MDLRNFLGGMVAQFADVSSQQLRPDQLTLEALCEAMHGHQSAAIGLPALADMWCKHGIQWFAQNMQPSDDIRTWVDRLEKDKAPIDGSRNIYMRFGRITGAPLFIAGTTSTRVCELSDKTFDAAKRVKYLACLPRLYETALAVHGKPIDANRKVYRFELMSHIAMLTNRMEHFNSLLGRTETTDTCSSRFNGKCEIAARWAEKFDDFFRVNATPDGKIKVLVQALKYNCFVSFIPPGLSEKASLWVERFPDVFEEASGPTTMPFTRTTAQMFLHIVTALPELFSALKQKEVDMDHEQISTRDVEAKEKENDQIGSQARVTYAELRGVIEQLTRRVSQKEAGIFNLSSTGTTNVRKWVRRFEQFFERNVGEHDDTEVPILSEKSYGSSQFKGGWLRFTTADDAAAPALFIYREYDAVPGDPIRVAEMHTLSLDLVSKDRFLRVVQCLPELFDAIKKNKERARGGGGDEEPKTANKLAMTDPRPLVLLPEFDHEKGEYRYPDGAVVNMMTRGPSPIWKACGKDNTHVTVYGRGTAADGYHYSSPGQAAAALLALGMGPASLPEFNHDAHMSASVFTCHGGASPEWVEGKVRWVATDTGEAILRHGSDNEGEVIHFDTLEAALEALEAHAMLPENTDDPDRTSKVDVGEIVNKTVKRSVIAAAKTVFEFTDGTWCEVLTEAKAKVSVDAG